MVEALQVTQINFDSMENHIEAARYVKGTVYFLDEPGKTADEKAQEWIAQQTVVSHEGWDGQMYPQFITSKITLR